MRNDLKEKRNTLVKEQEEKNSDNFVRRKLIFWLLAGMVVTRLIYVVLNTAYCLIYEISIPSFDFFISFFMVVAAFGFSFLIYSAGIRPVAYIALLGGLVSLFSAYNSGILSMLNTEDIFFNAVNIMFVVTLSIQIFVMLFIGFDKKCRLYLNVMAEIQKELRLWINNKQNK